MNSIFYVSPCRYSMPIPQSSNSISLVIIDQRVAERVEKVQESPVYFSHFPHKRWKSFPDSCVCMLRWVRGFLKLWWLSTGGFLFLLVLGWCASLLTWLFLHCFSSSVFLKLFSLVLLVLCCSWAPADSLLKLWSFRIRMLCISEYV